MTILTIRTDNPISEIGAYVNNQQIEYLKWQADRQLAETINTKIQQILDKAQLDLNKIEGIVAYKGPGSFTGLRIGLSVANALAQGLEIPIVSTSESDWIQEGINCLENGQNEIHVKPEYGALPNITTPKK